MTMQDMLTKDLKFGFMTGFADWETAKKTVDFAHKMDFDSLWVGDHVAFPVPIMDSLMQLAFAAAMTDRLLLGTGIYLLPLRHPTPVAKQLATLDSLTAGRLVFGVGIGGEFPNEYAACGVPIGERGARLGESVEVLKLLWSGEQVSYDGRYFQIDQVQMLPKPRQQGGPPVWFGGRQKAALRRAGRLADGYISYVITPDMYRAALDTIASGAEAAGRNLQQFGTGHLLFMQVDDNPDKAFAAAVKHLSRRYNMDFTAPTRKYAAFGRPEDVAARIDEFRAAGVRHFVLDVLSMGEDRDVQLQRFSEEIKPLLTA